MKRVAGITALAVIAAVAVLSGLGTSPTSGAASTYRFDVIFDNAKGIVPGQLAKIAGARVGKVKEVKLEQDYKARIQLEVDGRFAPFHTDATCTLQPEGLISENFVQCDPGSTAAPRLEGKGDKAPTVPVEHTTEPINLIDLFNVFRTPVRQRFSLIIATLGIGSAGRGDDINALLRRANPTLQLVRRATTILSEERRRLASSITDTDRIIAELVTRKDRVREFIDRAARVTTKTAEHRGDLGRTVNRLPGLLAAADPALKQLDALSVSGVPVLRNLRTAAPDLNRLSRGLPPFIAAALPVVDELDKTSRVGRKTARDAGATVKLLRQFAGQSGVTGNSLNDLLVNLRERGGIELVFDFVYFTQALTARFDKVSHLGPAHFVSSGQTCLLFATVTDPACDVRYNKQKTAAASAAPRSATPSPTTATRPAQATAPAAAVPAPTAAAPAATPHSGAVEQLTKPVTDLLGQVLGPVAGANGARAPKSVDDILSYLLK